MIYGSHILFAHSQAERGGNRTKVHGVVVLESERGEGGGDVACGWANGVCGML